MNTSMNTSMNMNTSKIMIQSQFNFELLNKYMLNEPNLNKIIKNGTTYDSSRKTLAGVANNHNNNQPKENKPKDDTFFPPEHDSLFWSFYILKNGQDAYESLGKINIVIERKIKIEYIERIRQNKQVLKAHKTAPVTHIENALLNELQIDIKTFIALCVLEGISFMYIYKNTYYEMNIDTDESTEIHSITRMEMPTRYGYKLVKDSKHIRETFYKIENLGKPLKAMTAYKLDELVVFCNKLGINLEHDAKTKPHKKDLYEKLVQYFAL